jgi:hypothetical protein
MASDSKLMTPVAALSDEVVNATASVESDAILINKSDTFTYWVQATSVAGTPDIDIEFMVSPYPDSGFVRATSSSAVNINNEIANSDPAPMPRSIYCKIKVTGINSNPADTIVNLVLIHG